MEETREKRRDKALIAGIIISYACFFISTIFRADFFIELFSPLTAALIGLTIINCLRRMGAFWLPSFILALGIFSYMVADIFIFVGDYILHTDKLYNLAAFIFLLPNYFFGASVALYFIQKLKGRELYHFLVNTLTLTVIGFIGLRKFLIFMGSYELLDRGELIRVYMYFTINLFILIMIGHMIVMIASEIGFKGTNTMILGILLYILLDIPYTYSQAIGNDPENIYANLIYMACMILMAHGIYHQVHHHHVFKLKAYQYTERSARRTRIIVSVGILMSIVLFASKTIEQNEFFYVVLAMAAYWITTSTFQNSALNEQILKQQDLLTGLYNRRYSSNVLAESVRKAGEQGLKFAVLCIDLNSFKPINDTYGHDMGDRVLKEFGNRMLALSSDYTCFRTGGDEFMIVKDGVVGKTDLCDAAGNIQKLFHTPIHLDTYIFSLSGSIGVSVYPDDSREPEELIRYADAAMYSVKHSQNKDDYRIFDVSLVETVEKHKALEERMRKADPAKDFVLHYQPRIDAENGELTAAEVFPRLRGEQDYTAADILPIAEEVGLMSRLGNWIMETSIRQVKAWKDTFGKELSISINISPLQLLDMDFISNLKHVTSECGLEPSVIHLDISNDVIMGASITAKESLRSLNEYGFQLSLNDFGGYDINLSHVLNCGFSAIHISAALIKRAEEEESANILIRSVIALADTMGIKAYAVGVESAEQAKKLKDMGVDALQGYYYGKPEEAEAFEKEHLR
jgi:diguanylate cyclase (GGDEF)-like protein